MHGNCNYRSLTKGLKHLGSRPTNQVNYVHDSQQKPWQPLQFAPPFLAYEVQHFAWLGYREHGNSYQSAALGRRDECSVSVQM
jgi:hypothetical protein